MIALLAGTCLAAPAFGQETWLANPGSSDFNTASNWDPASVPSGIAIFGNYEQSYANHLREKLIADPKGHVLQCGLTGVPKFWDGKIDEQQEAFFRSFIKK